MSNNQLTLFDKREPLNDKESFLENIKKWVVIDSQLKIIHEKTKKMRHMKHELTDQICYYKKSNNIHPKISISDGELIISEKKEYSPITFTYIEKCLQKIVSDQEHVEFIINYLKENREINVVSEIRRTTTK